MKQIIFIFIGVVFIIFIYVCTNYKIQPSLDIGNLLFILSTVIVGLYVASEIPKKLSSNRNEQDFIIRKIEKIIGNYVDANDLIVKKTFTLDPLSLGQIISITEKNTTDVHSLEMHLKNTQMKKLLKNEIGALIKLDRSFKKLLTANPNVQDSFVSYSHLEISQINILSSEIEDCLIKCIIKINRK